MMKYIYKGAIHVHSRYSDGTSTILEIAKDAKKAGLSFVIISDHNSLKALENNEEGFYDGVLILIGNEISPETSNHYLAFDVSKVCDVNEHPQEFIDDTTSQGGFGFIAHPHESLERKNHYKPLRWEYSEVKGFGGIEIWNLLSDFTDNFSEDLSGIFKFFFYQKFLKGPTFETLKWWDDENLKQERIVPAICGSDAHALIIKKGILSVKVLSYLESFKSLTNFLYLEEKLSEDFETAKKQVYKAVKQGNNIIQNCYLSPVFPEFYVENSGLKAYAGEISKLDEYSKLVVNLPKKALLRVIQDGKLVYEYETKSLQYEIRDKGKYRIEVYLKNRPFIFTNPILVN